jgi:hypothetical protein
MCLEVSIQCKVAWWVAFIAYAAIFTNTVSAAERLCAKQPLFAHLAKQMYKVTIDTNIQLTLHKNLHF